MKSRARTRPLWQRPGAMFWVLWVLSAAAAGVEKAKQDKDLTTLDLITLMQMDVEVTSVSKRETRLADAATAIAVITSEDIRRLGLTSIAEALRIIPGVDVARISANEWAIGSRGFNLQYAAKLLVLVDGRSVYTPTSGGVYWNDQHPLMEDIARIEVIRGPGATLWGANAVNGVINIITKNAADTPGTLLSAAYGTLEQPDVGLRYGGKWGEGLAYRASIHYFDHANFEDGNGVEVPDAWSSTHGSLRIDWRRSAADDLTLIGNLYAGKAGQAWHRPVLTEPFSEFVELHNDNHGGSVLARWNHRISDTSSTTLQLYFDSFQHGDAGTDESRDTYDLEWQHSFAPGRHRVTWGFGLRRTFDELPPTFYLTYTPEHATETLYSFFAQDDIALRGEDLMLTVGSKFEHHEHTGLAVQPSVRLLWQPSAGQTLWGSVSKAMRTPSRFERDARFNAAVTPPAPPEPANIFAFIGDKGLDPEEVVSYELGYRSQRGAWYLDAAAFYNDYERLIGIVDGEFFFESQPPPEHSVFPVLIANNGRGETYGGELMLNWEASENWRLTAGYSRIYMRLKPDDFYLSSGDSPENQFHLRSYIDLPHELQVNGAAYYVDRLPNQRAPDYVRLDLGLLWQYSPSTHFGVWGANLLDRRHFEFGSFNTVLRSEVPRTMLGKITWKF